MSFYDQLHFESRPAPERHPSRLATIAVLSGMNPARLEQCRVLELGCSTGSNILPIAFNYPQAQFVGVDASLSQVDRGKQLVSKFGLTNVTLLHSLFAELPENLGKFDYIVCHGVFSWVAPNVQEQVLAIIAEHLTPEGLAMVSFNTAAGWSIRNTVRHLLLQAINSSAEPGVQVEQARSRIREALDAQFDDFSSYGLLLKEELEGLSRQTDAYMFHDVLSEHNQGFWLSEFVGMLDRFELQFVADAQIRVDTLTGNNTTEELIKAEELSEALFPRPVRSIVLARAELTLNRELTADKLRSLYVTSPLVPSIDGSSDEESSRVFFDSKGIPQRITDSVASSIVKILSANWPTPIPTIELHERVKQSSSASLWQRVTGQSSEQQFFAQLLKLFCDGLVELSFCVPTSDPRMRESLTINPFVREQLSKQLWATNYRHEYMEFTNAEAQLIQLLDGTRTKVQVQTDFAALIKPDETSEPLEAAIVQEFVEQTLEKLKNGAFFGPLKN